MPDKWGRPQMSDWMGIMQAVNTVGSIQDRNTKRVDQRGIEVGMGSISSQQDEGIALGDMEKPEDVSERQWAEALANKHSLAGMNEQRKSAAYDRWHQDFKKNKDEAQKAIAVLKGQKDTGITENQRKEGLFDFFNKHVYDNQRYIGTETKPDGSIVQVFENSITEKRIEQPDSTADEMLWAADDYLNRWFDKTAPAARSLRINKNRQGLLNPTKMINDSGDTVFLYPQVKRGTDGYESVMVRKNPAKEANPSDPIDFTETTVAEWVAKGYKEIPRPNKTALDIQGKQVDIAGKKAGQLQKSMDFISKQLGVVPDKRNSDDDIMAMALGEQGADMPAMSTLKAIIGKMEGGLPEEKALATSWLQMAGELYPGLKNIPKNDLGKKDPPPPPPPITNDFVFTDADNAGIVKNAQAKRIKLKEANEAKKVKKAKEQRNTEIHPDYRQFGGPVPGFGAGSSMNARPPQQNTAVNVPQNNVNKAIPDRVGGFTPPQGVRPPMVQQQNPTPQDNLPPVPFQYNPDEEAYLRILNNNRSRGGIL